MVKIFTWEPGMKPRLETSRLRVPVSSDVLDDSCAPDGPGHMLVGFELIPLLEPSGNLAKVGVDMLPFGP